MSSSLKRLRTSDGANKMVTVKLRTQLEGMIEGAKQWNKSIERRNKHIENSLNAASEGLKTLIA